LIFRGFYTGSESTFQGGYLQNATDSYLFVLFMNADLATAVELGVIIEIGPEEGGSDNRTLTTQNRRLPAKVVWDLPTICGGGKGVLKMDQYEMIRTSCRVYGKNISEMAPSDRSCAQHYQESDTG
jgi:hypothetical protein